MNVLYQYASDILRVTRAVVGEAATEQAWFAARLWYFAITRKLFKYHLSDYRLPITVRGMPVVYYLRYSMDIAVLREIYAEKEYDWCPIEKPNVLVDLGAHFGDTALYYHARYPEAKIVAVEPSPENFARLVKHVKDIPNIIPIQAAVGSADGTVAFTLGESGLGHSLVERKDRKSTVEVQQLTLKSLLRVSGIERADLIKFDIEGGEYAMFEGVKPEEYADAYIGEVHPDLVPEGTPDLALRFGAFTVERDTLPRGRYLMRAKRVR